MSFADPKLELRPKLNIYTYRKQSVVGMMQQGKPQVVADKQESVLLLKDSLRAAPESLNDMDVLSARPINLREFGDPQKGLV
jgi:hypothetical protein